jgi:hypothetical protein
MVSAMTLDPIERLIVATALLAMFAECPAAERPEAERAFAAISRKLGLGDAYRTIAQQAQGAREAGQP